MGLAMAQEIIPNRWWNGRILRCESVGVAFSMEISVCMVQRDWFVVEVIYDLRTGCSVCPAGYFDII